ncbi:MAG: TonB-dependent receptor plug domain-containing protein [Bacteroidales bacterium]|jgi:outer membrane receptor protein involved in Fe transport|nr:TonB-dependent receptor plug domain-containing protein [Bacteroidales bacterium]
MKYFTGIIICMFCFNIARAQEAISALDSSFLDMIKLGEIVISASKDNVTYKSIPASVSVIPEASLTNNRIASLAEISSLAPNLYMPDYGSKLTAPIYIRGIGSRINSPSVGLYVDYVPYFEKSAFNFDFFDVKRIEVLRGPQGSQFGRNTMGGIINVVTTSPVDYSGGNVNLTYGIYGYSAQASYFGKAGKKLAYSLSLNGIHNDGFYTNEYTGKKVDGMNSYGARSRVVYEAGRRTTVENIAAFELSSQGGYPYALYVDSLGADSPINYNEYSSYDRTLFSDAVIVKHDADKFDFTATTSYQHLDDYQGIDQDFTPRSLYFIEQTQYQHMLSQEAVVKSKDRNRRYRWLFGAYGFFQGLDNAVTAQVHQTASSYVKRYSHNILGYAFFHQSTVNDFIVNNLSVTAGLRLDAETDNLYYRHSNILPAASTVADTTYPALNSLEILPRLALNYTPGKMSFYAVVARGYKTGGFNSTFERPQDLMFAPEYSWNYEVGVKTPLWRNIIFADMALYYIDWRDQQIYQTVPSGRGAMLKNAGHSASRGGELTLSTTPLKGYEASVAYGYTDATFLSYVVKEGDEVNYNGNRLPYVPKHTLSVQASKTFELAGNRHWQSIRVNAIYRGNGPITWDEANSHTQNYYGVCDARVSLVSSRVQFSLWAKNIFNAKYESFFFDALGNSYAQFGKPGQYGLTLAVKFSK